MKAPMPPVLAPITEPSLPSFDDIASDSGAEDLAVDTHGNLYAHCSNRSFADLYERVPSFYSSAAKSFV